jgi:hypothetical protein
MKLMIYNIGRFLKMNEKNAQKTDKDAKKRIDMSHTLVATKPGTLRKKTDLCFKKDDHWKLKKLHGRKGSLTEGCETDTVNELRKAYPNAEKILGRFRVVSDFNDDFDSLANVRAQSYEAARDYINRIVSDSVQQLNDLHCNLN